MSAVVLSRLGSIVLDRTRSAVMGEPDGGLSAAADAAWTAENLSDGELVVRLQRGRMEYADELVARHSAALQRVLRNALQDDQLAEDMLQETWLKVIDRIDRFDVSRDFRPWLFRIGINCCRDHWRRRKVRRFLRLDAAGDDERPIELPDPAAEDAVEERVDVNQLLAVLSPKHREVVVLKFYSGLSHDEIAEALGIPSGTAKSRLHNALRQLREELSRGGNGR